MAFTALINALFLPGKPILGSTGLALRDNIAATAEGATGAPRVRVGALQRLTAGSEVRIRNDDPPGGASGTALDFALLQYGECRVTFERRSGGTTITLRRYRGGAPVTIYSGDPETTQTFDVSVQPGDRITLTWTGSNSADGVINARMQTGGEDYFPVEVSAGVVEGNTYNA